MLEELRRFAAPPGRWSSFEERHRRRDLASIPVQEVRLENDSWVDDRVALRRVDVPTGLPLDDAKLRRQLMELYGLEYFGNIHDDLRVDDGRGSLTIRTPAKLYSRGSLQFGMSFESDLEGDATYAFTTRHQVLAVNRLGGEWVNVLQVGGDIVAQSEFYQPLDWGMSWFVSPSAVYRNRDQKIWVDGEPVAEYTFKIRQARLDVGRVFGNWGEIRAEASRDEESASPRGIALGGFLRLSGLGVNELFGNKGGVARAVYYREIARLSLGSLTNRI